MFVLVSTITLAAINWQNVIAGSAVLGTVAYNFAKHRADKRGAQEASAHNSINELTTIYKELVDDLRAEVDRLKETNKALHAEVSALRADNKTLTAAVDALTLQIATLGGGAKGIAS